MRYDPHASARRPPASPARPRDVQLCSLNPGVDRLAFSIGWEMEADGTILSQWAGRSIICSCAKLAYGHAQAVISGEDTGQGAGPVEITGGHTWAQCAEDVRALHAIAQAMRGQRFASGSIRLDNIKLMFERDECGNPESMWTYVTKEANWLVEEFMLLANRSAAKMLTEVYPESSFLRRHAPPDMRKLVELEAMAA